jgi:anti-sigma regulatory factor (Ser/Thr protein kinase)
MILEKQTQSLIQEVGSTQGTIGMSLDLDSAQVLMQMLSKNLYADAIGSTVRECASNALDSHRRAGKNNHPIIVSFKSINNSYEFSVEDFGIGLDADDVENIISKYGKSTKRESTTELGMMGLGFKAPLAYASSFYFIARKNGRERKYMMYEGEEVNSIDLLSDSATSESNGVKIIIPVKWTDAYEFKKKIKEQLAYFENVYFDVPDMNNTFNIYRSEHYQISDVCPDHEMHVCLDNVYYPLDFDKLGISRIYHSRIGLRFSLTDGLFPTPNRESLRYTQEAKQLIKNKITILANEFMTKYNETIADTDDVRAVIDHFSTGFRHITDHNGDKWEVSEILKHATISVRTPTLIGCKYFTAESLYKIRDYMLNEYECKHELSNYRARISDSRSRWDSDVTFTSLHRADRIAIFTGVFGDRKRRYIKELWAKKSAKFIKKSHPFTLFSKDKGWATTTHYSNPDMRCYHDLLKLYNYPKSQWREVITEFQTCLNKVTDSFIDLDAIDIPEAWIVADKLKNYKPKPKAAKNGKIKEKGDVNVKEATSPERETGSNAKFVPMVYDGKTLHKRKKLTVYAKEEDRTTLDHLFGMFKKVENEIVFVIMSDREIKVLEMYGLHNFMPLATFLKGHNKPFKRMMTAKLIFMFKGLYNRVFDVRNVLDEVNSGLKKDLDELYDYQEKMIYTWAKETNTTLKLDEYASKHNLYDLEMFTKLNRTDKMFSKHPFIKKLCNKMSGSYGNAFDYKGLLDVMKDMCRYKNMRMNLDNYKITEGYVPVEEGQLSLFVA